MESMKKQNDVCSQNDFLFDALEGIALDKECFHTPDMLEFLAMIETDYGIVQHFQCSCGKTVKEVFTSSGRVIT